jgi:regulator of sigma E protease
MTEFLTNTIAFVVLISILVAVHEYGHFIVGRWTGMKVLRFSIGFGKPIWTYVGKKDRTEFCISAIPLGGYVRFLDSREGDVSKDDEGRAFDHRPIPARIAVLLAGPLFNFIFAIAAYWLLFAGGVTVSQPAVGTVLPDSYADQAGLEFGDKILAVGGSKTEGWESALFAILGEMVNDGRVPMTLESANGDRREAVINVGGDKTRLTEPGLLFDGLGFQPWQPPSIIGDLPDDGAAGTAGLALGDQIISIDKEIVRNFNDLRSIVGPRAGKSVVIGFIRNGAEDSLQLVIGQRQINGEVRGYLGVGLSEATSDYYIQRAYSPLESLRAAVDKTWTSSVFTIQMLGRMVTGDVSIKNISGPINIAQIAGDSAVQGWRRFVGVLAIISISLGVLNLLPIPILDGGQIVYQLIEALKGDPLTERAQILGQQAGILALLLLMSFAFYNDFARIFG